MDAKVKEFIENKRENERFEKEQFLISIGLYTEGERKYSAKWTSEYPNWDDEKKQYYNVPKIACKVTEEEFNEILKYSNPAPKEPKTNIVGYVLMTIGIITIVAGIITGMAIGSWIVALYSILSALLLIAFGKISTTLTDIYNLLNLKS